MLNTGPSIGNLEAYKMKQFLKDLWETWKSVQQERAAWFTKHGSTWE